ncbi:MAG TPA: ERCC4 domain-containing protein, partial [Chitinophagaceae bacterium]|nr:ERCC4 domain-containing protein [Chitinophagaceae bacterium]
MPVPIQIDHRENPSGVPELLAGNAEVSLEVSSLRAGDYIINEVIGVERKSAEDFVQSIISNRLFEQLSRLKKSVARPLLIVEGNPYKTTHTIHAHSIRGALLSALLAWQVPVMFSKNKEDTAVLLLMAA